MTAASMSNHVSCDECEDIAREIAEAYRDAWISGDQAFRDAWVATYQLIGGTEEDASRTQELVSAAHVRNPLRINRVLHRKLAHEARSGHKIPLPAQH
jgi:hypothetical protein